MTDPFSKTYSNTQSPSSPFAKKWPIVLLVVAGVGIVTTFFLRILTPPVAVIPQTEFVTTNKDGVSSRFSQITYTGSEPEMPSSLYLVQISPQENLGEAAKNLFIEKNKVEPLPNISDVWKNNEYLVVKSQEENPYSIARMDSHKENIIQNEEQGLKNAQEFVDLYFGGGKFTPLKTHILYLSGMDELEESSKKDAMIMEIPFTYSIIGLPVYIGHFSKTPIVVSINSDAQIQKVVFQKDFLDFTVTRNKLESISVTEALENINQRHMGTVISAYSEFVGELSLDEFVRGTLRTVELEYRADLTQKIAYPFYRFSGELINKDGKPISAEVITPAVKIQ